MRARRRVEHIATLSLHWARREQQPHADRGTCDISCIHAMRFSDAEIAHATKFVRSL